MTERVLKFKADKDSVLIEFLAIHLGSSKTKIKQLVKHGAVSVNGTAVERAEARLRPGDLVEIGPGHKTKAPFKILYEDQDLLAVIKPAGVLSISTEKEKEDTFYRVVSDYVKAETRGRGKIFIVHRLDREASGVMLFAKNKKTKDALQENWGKSEKFYYAVVEGEPPQNEGTVKSWLCENKAHIVYACGKETEGARLSVTHYRLLKRESGYALLEIRLQTGRKNQIRAHMQELGCPIAGDKKYGAGTNPLGRLGLHAFSLSFAHPETGKMIKLATPLPDAFKRVLSRPEK